jgi:hypothetical protein
MTHDGNPVSRFVDWTDMVQYVSQQIEMKGTLAALTSGDGTAEDYHRYLKLQKTIPIARSAADAEFERNTFECPGENCGRRHLYRAFSFVCPCGMPLPGDEPTRFVGEPDEPVR